MILGDRIHQLSWLFIPKIGILTLGLNPSTDKELMYCASCNKSDIAFADTCKPKQHYSNNVLSTGVRDINGYLYGTKGF